MKIKISILFYFYAMLLISCNPKPKDSLAQADSANKANIDTGLQTHSIVIDPASADFLVRIADVISSEKEVAYLTMHQGVNPAVKDFAAILYHELEGLNDSVQSLRMQKNIILPSQISADRQTGIDVLKKIRGGALDIAFVDYVIQSHEFAVKIFADGINNAKDEDIRNFADICGLLFRKYLNTAKTLK